MTPYMVTYRSRQQRFFATSQERAIEKGIDYFRVPDSEKHLVSAQQIFSVTPR